jgi:hypothetical protein
MATTLQTLVRIMSVCLMAGGNRTPRNLASMLFLGEHGIAGEGVFQKNYQWFIRLYNGTEFFVTEFRNGMKLGDLPYSLLLS